MLRTIGKEKEYKKRRLFAALWTLLVCAAVAVLFFVLLSWPFKAVEDTMSPAIAKGDVLILGRYSFYLKSPVRGDIAAFAEETAPNGTALRRVIALEGESVACKDGQVYINGILLDESAYADRGLAEFPPFKVPKGCVYLLPDVREGLTDAGAILEITALLGRVNFRTAPIGNAAIF